MRQPGGPFPSYQAVESRGCLATFDCSDAKRNLDWKPVADRDEFISAGITVYGRR